MRISAHLPPVVARMLLALVLLVAVLAPAAGPVQAGVPARVAQRADFGCQDDLPTATDSRLPTRVLMAPGNGYLGRRLTFSLSYVPLAPATVSSESMASTKVGLTRSRLEQVERRGVRAAYFAGWRDQVRQDTRRLVERVADCPREAQVLMGYSQGALVVRTVLRNLSRTAHGRDVLDHLAGVVLVGDPTADPRERIVHLGRSRGTGILAARIPLPRPLVHRGLVTSLCTSDDPVCSSTPRSRRGSPSPATAGALVRSHLGYAVGSSSHDTDPLAQRIGWQMGARLMQQLDKTPGWRTSGSGGSPDSQFSTREGDPFTQPAGGSGFRLVPAATTLPAGVQASPDLELSGIAPDPDHDDVVVGYTSTTVAPAVVRQQTFSLNSWARQTARPGVSRVSHAVGGGPANGASYQADLADDGQHVAFVARASDLVLGDPNGSAPDIFVWDRATDTTKRLAVGDESTGWPQLSADGRYVEFTTRSKLAGDTDALADVFVWDTQADTVQLASPGTAVPVSAGTITPDGSTVFFREDPAGSDPVGNTVSSWDRGSATVTTVAPPPGQDWMVEPQFGRPWVASPDGRYAAVVQRAAPQQAALWDRHLDVQHGTACAPGSGTRHGFGDVAADGSVFSYVEISQGTKFDVTAEVTCETATGTRTSRASSFGRTLAFSPTGLLELDSAADVPAIGDRTSDLRTRPVDDPTRLRGTGLLTTVGPATLSADAATVAFSSATANILETIPANFGQAEVYLWDRTVSP